MNKDYTCWSPRELIERIHELERAMNGILDTSNTPPEKEEARIRAFEALGCTRSDAQAIVEAEQLQGII